MNIREFEPSQLFRRLRGSRVVHNITALLGTQVARYVFPLIVIPYLARILGPSWWGIVAVAQALGMYFTAVVDFGFQLSTTRRIARARGNAVEMEKIFAGTLGAKCLLALLCVLTMFLLEYIMPSLRQNRVVMWEGALSGIIAGFNMLWFYQGIEDMRLAATMDVVGRALYAVGIFLFVHRKEDVSIVLAIQLVSFSAITLVMLVLAYRQVSFRWPTPELSFQALRESASMFLFSGAISLYTTANTLILGMVATPFSVGLFSGAEKLMRVMAGILLPFSQSLYPRINRLMLTDEAKAIHLARVSLMGMGALGLLLGAATYLAAPLIVHLALGDRFSGSIPVLRILAVLLPLLGLSNVLGMQWMLPLSMDRAFNVITLSAGVLNIFLGYWASRHWQHIGMACAVACAELVVTCSMAAVLMRKSISPWTRNDLLLPVLKQRIASHVDEMKA